MGDWNGEVADETKAIELDASIAESWSHRGAARLQTGDVDGAIADFERYLELAPTGSDAPSIRRFLEERKATRPR